MKKKSCDEFVERFIREALPKIKEVLKPKVVLLFGSRIKGVCSEESDMDVAL